MALTKVTEGVRTLGTGEVAIGNISGSAAAPAGAFLKQDGTWGSAGAADSVFWENAQTVSSNYSITAGTNALTLGNLIINSGITVTIPSGARWYIL